MTRRLKSITFALGAGLMAALSLIGLYLSVLSIGKSSSEALVLFWQNKWMLLLVALGFAIQLGMYIFVRRGLHRPLTVPGGTVTTTASGGTSSLAMLACCAPALVNALPLLGFTALTTLLAEQRMAFFALSMLGNVVGITVMGVALWKARRQQIYLRAS